MGFSGKIVCCQSASTKGTYSCRRQPWIVIMSEKRQVTWPGLFVIVTPREISQIEFAANWRCFRLLPLFDCVVWIVLTWLEVVIWRVSSLLLNVAEYWATTWKISEFWITINNSVNSPTQQELLNTPPSNSYSHSQWMKFGENKNSKIRHLEKPGLNPMRYGWNRQRLALMCTYVTFIFAPDKLLVHAR